MSLQQVHPETPLLRPDMALPDGIDLPHPYAESPGIGPEQPHGSLEGQVYLSVGTTTYGEFYEAGKKALEQAVKIEATDGLEAAAASYMEAKYQFIGAVGSQPVEVARHEERTDPQLLLDHAACLSKLVRTSFAEDPYTDKASRDYDRREVWTGSAIRTFETGIELLMDRSPDEQTLFPAALAAAGGLRSLGEHDKADRILIEASQRLRIDLGDSELADFIDRQLVQSSIDSSQARHVAHVALLDLATDSHEVFSLV